MANRRLYDPLAFVPSPDVIREKLCETLTLAERLRLLLELAERMRLPLTTLDAIAPTIQAKGAARG